MRTLKKMIILNIHSKLERGDGGQEDQKSIIEAAIQRMKKSCKDLEQTMSGGAYCMNYGFQARRN